MTATITLEKINTIGESPDLPLMTFEEFAEPLPLLSPIRREWQTLTEPTPAPAK